MSEVAPAKEFFRQMFGGSWITQGIGVAAELGIAEHLADGPRSTSELASLTGSHDDSLYRLLRALSAVGVFAEEPARCFSLTPLATMLRTDVPASQRSFATMMSNEFDAAWGELLHSVRTGEAGFEKRYGLPFFDYMTRHPERHRIYDEAMTGVHGVETVPVLDAYPFAGRETVVDIGGGNGLALAALLERYPLVNGILFDLPAVADRAREGLSGTPESDRLKIEGGDFFTAVPAGADIYMLRHIIHDWQDAEAIAILTRCREAAAPGARILVIEMVVPPANQPGFGKWLDIMMLLVGGRERTAEEYGELFGAAGLELARIIPTASDVSIVEGVCPP